MTTSKRFTFGKIVGKQAFLLPVGMNTGATLMERHLAISNKTTCDILVRHHLADIPATTQKYTYTRLLIAALFVIAKYYKPHIRPYKRMNILWNIHTMESVFAVAEKQEEGEISKN